MIEPVASFLWRKVDHPGHDACRLFELATGWRLTGAAIFREGGKPCHLEYDVAADTAWRTRSARVRGYVGRQPVDLRITSAGGRRWRLNGALVESVTGCVDVDLGFTPATNLIAIRRLALRVGQRAEAPAAYLSFPAMRMVKLPQSYVRVGRAEYQYEAPTVGYSGRLRVLPSGAVSRYPGLFEQVTSG